MSPRSGALRRRRKPSLGTRLKIAWVFIVMAVAAAGYAGYTIVTLPQLRVHAVDVQIAGLDVSEREVLAAAGIDRRANVWLLDTGRMARRIEAIPYVDRADIRRAPPADLTIAVTLREPVACVSSGPQLVTVDRRQRVLQTGCARPSAIAIELRGARLGAPGTYASQPALGALLADERELDRARIGVRSIGEDAFGQLVAVDDSGVSLLFGSDGDLAAKAKLVAPVRAATQNGRAIEAIDLRAPATPTVRFR